jgi:hypothetical protein
MERCLVCPNKADFHHLKAVGMGRNRNLKRWEDLTVVPLCREHHAEIHKIGRVMFEKKYNINLWKILAVNLAKRIFYGDERM